jgi:hypothetical protein
VARAALIIIWIAALGSVGALGVIGYDIARSGPAVPKATSNGRLPVRQGHNPWARWTVTQQFSAHHVMTVQVETTHLSEAVAIAQQIIDPIKDDYAEILIYFHRPGRPDVLPPRRVQWRAKTGYVESVYE